MTKTFIGYARCSTDKQDLSVQRNALIELGVAADRIYTDHGLTGTNRSRPGLDQALAAVRLGDTLVVPKLDRLARSVPDARDIADSLIARGVKLALGTNVYDPTDPMGKMFFNILATFAEFEADLIRMRTRARHSTYLPSSNRSWTPGRSSARLPSRGLTPPPAPGG
jgi:DNA invertase Pin-like site-specific DNA recombinase